MCNNKKGMGAPPQPKKTQVTQTILFLKSHSEIFVYFDCVQLSIGRQIEYINNGDGVQYINKNNSGKRDKYRVD